MRVIVSAAMSVDGFLDDESPHRLILSSNEDFDAVNARRAQCDAIMVGAGTIRSDNPSLITKTEKMVSYRKERGMSVDPVKVTITRSGNIGQHSNFLQKGDCEKIIYCPQEEEENLPHYLNKLATVICLPRNNLSARGVVEDLERRGFSNLLVEGGSTVLTMFFSEDQVDDLHLSIAPFFVGEENAPRLVNPANFPYSKGKRMGVKGVNLLGDTIAIHFILRRS